MSLRRKIAVFCSQIEGTRLTEFMKGFQREAFALDYDICIFSSFYKEPSSYLNEIGDTSIFNIVNLKLFDAVMVVPDSMPESELNLRLEKMLHESFEGKVLYIDRESEYFPYLLIDHYTPFYELIRHLIEKHGYKDIASINGYRRQNMNVSCERAFKKCMEDHNLTIGSHRMFMSNYYSDSEIDVVDKLLESKTKLPEVIVCASDEQAIRVAAKLEKYGYKVPEDVAVTGYESVERGQKAPSPITSVILDFNTMGAYSLHFLDNLIKGRKTEALCDGKDDLFIGTSCGCDGEDVVPEKPQPKTWGDSLSLNAYYSSMKKFGQDMILQSSIRGLLDTIQTYTYQIREYNHLSICLNETWADDSNASKAVEGYFTPNMIEVLKCGPTGENPDVVDITNSFSRKMMVPALFEVSEKPRTFIFTPLYYDNVVFGYSVINYGTDNRMYDKAYREWMLLVMLGLENFRRNRLRMKAMLENRKGLDQESENSIYDTLTGLFNYEGFLKHASALIEREKNLECSIFVLALDIADLDSVNSKFGRKGGNEFIRELGRIVAKCADASSICCRLGNDEFVVAGLSQSPSSELADKLQKKISERLEDRNKQKDIKAELKVYFGNRTGYVSTEGQLEDLLNEAVSNKNGNKARERQLINGKKLGADEKKLLQLVNKILDENLFTYHFQPIVDARDGKIFAYEALMRSTSQTTVSPLDILKYAELNGRLTAVERATFANVTDFVKKNNNLFEGKKVFINSIPGNHLTGAEAEGIIDRIEGIGNSLVVELTEQTEISDEELVDAKEHFGLLGMETAVDDYGTGYSNIVNLLRYAPNYVKIDRMLLCGIDTNPQKQHFVKDVVSFAHANRFKALAEGIETAEEMKTVIDLGVDYIQGYYTARPSGEVIPEIPEKIMCEIRSYYLSNELEKMMPGRNIN